jgi:hypothetical protein
LFHNRFFQREEGGTNLRQVWLEVQIQHDLSMAQQGECSDAIKAVDDLAQPVTDLHSRAMDLSRSYSPPGLPI